MGGEPTSDAETLADLLVCNPRFLRATTGHAALDDSFRELADRGPSRVAVTLPAEGVVGPEEGRWVRIPGFRFETVDTSGAGDVFHGAYAVGELHGWTLEWTLTFANAVAALKCRVLGGRRGIPRPAVVIEFIEVRGRPDIARSWPDRQLGNRTARPHFRQVSRPSWRTWRFSEREFRIG